MSEISTAALSNWHSDSTNVEAQNVHQAYLQAQRKFWNVEEQELKFGRVDTESKNDREYELRADRDFHTIFSGVEITEISAVLEIGCGVGRLLSRLLAHTNPGKIIGVDLSQRMIEKTQAALGSKQNVMLAVNSGSDLSAVSDMSIDFAYSKDVFIHIHDIVVVKSYFREVRRILKPNGLFRFNVRRMDLANMFSNSLGGLAAKLSYLIGVNSSIKNTDAMPTPGFDGLEYSERDLRVLMKEARLSMATTVHLGHIWCTCWRAD